MKTLLVTGGAGFIGSNFIRYFISRHPDVTIVNLDKLTYAGNLENLGAVDRSPHYKFIKGDIVQKKTVETVFENYGIDAVVNFAAESHVDRSILSPDQFLKTNILGLQVLLSAARRHRVKRFVQISTDEVYGSAGQADPPFTENESLRPNNPYSASKAGADLLVRSFCTTYQMPAVITRCANNYGPFQFPEKLIPLTIINAQMDRPIPVYGDGLHVRNWLYVEDHCRAIDTVLRKGKVGEIYNIGGPHEMTNLEVVQTILREMKKPASLIHFVKDRPGHDRRYSISTDKISRELDWKPQSFFGESIVSTIQWYLRQEEWWKKIMSGEYRKYYKRNYGNRS
jgi:dTDP-glucose 4,6-dehydratase